MAKVLFKPSNQKSNNNHKGRGIKMPVIKKVIPTVQAEKLATKAVKVFDDAVADVEKAIAVLSDDILADSFKVQAIEDKTAKAQEKAEAEIEVIKADQTAKGAQVMEYKQLLNKLKGITN